MKCPHKKIGRRRLHSWMPCLLLRKLSCIRPTSVYDSSKNGVLPILLSQLINVRSTHVHVPVMLTYLLLRGNGLSARSIPVFLFSPLTCFEESKGEKGNGRRRRLVDFSSLHRLESCLLSSFVETLELRPGLSSRQCTET